MKRMMFFAMMVVAAAALAGPNFSGTWTLDKEKSELPDPGQGRGPGGFMASTMVVTQESNAMSVERTVAGRDGQDRTMTTKFAIDGKVVKESGERGTTETQAAWQAETMVVETLRKFEGQGRSFEMNRTEKWSLSEDGKVLTITYTQTSQRGDSKGKAVYAIK